MYGTNKTKFNFFFSTFKFFLYQLKAIPLEHQKFRELYGYKCKEN